MTIKRIITLAAIALLPIAAGAATFVIPAAGTGAGAAGSQWQTELTLHSTSGVAFTAPYFIDTGKFPASSGLTFGPELYYRPGRVLLGGEYYWENVRSAETLWRRSC